MGKIDELIKELCPDGVEYVKLGEIAEIGTGSSNTNEGLEEGLYPFYTRGRTILRKNEYEFEEEAVITAGDGDVGKVIHYMKGKYALHQRAYRFRPNENLICRFLFHYMLETFQKYICGNAVASSVVSLRKPKLITYPIPLPPLSIQQEIVDILDTFTDSIRNLQEELGLREKQMEYYRENIMTSEKVWKTLGEIGTLIRGKRFCHRDAVENGIPCIHYGELYTYYGVSTDVTKSFVRDDLAAKLRFAKKGDVVIVGAGENDIDIGVGVAYYGVKQVAVHDACYTLSNHNMSPKFISYWLRTNTYHQQIRQYVSSGKICSISTEGLAKARIPAPSLSRQQEIVDILDTFESMIANIKQEIELRQKQYEYYREKLLTFD